MTSWGGPPPKPGDGDVLESVIEDLKSRRELGIRKYGTPLQADNGRRALKDAYEEVLDLAAYLKQELIEDEQRREAEEERCEK